MPGSARGWTSRAWPGSRTGPIPSERAELEKDIEQTWGRQASAADALAATADVKAQAAATADRVGAKVSEVSERAPGSGTQQTGVLVGVILAATVLAVWLVVREN